MATEKTGPLCKKCNGSDRIPFPMCPKTPGYAFGEICAKCDGSAAA